MADLRSVCSVGKQSGFQPFSLSAIQLSAFSFQLFPPEPVRVDSGRNASRFVDHMSRARSLLVCLFAALWLPATLHCAIDSAGLFEAASECCEHELAGDVTASCDTACEFVASSGQTQAAVVLKPVAPAFLPLLDCPLRALTDLDPSLGSFEQDPEATFRIQRTWHFLARAALPVRAPAAIHS